jgi:glycosyltransferase involved in cell wall biosynthesis
MAALQPGAGLDRRSPDSMRVLIVTPEFPPHVGGGILRYYHALAPALARAGAQVTVMVAAPTSPDFADYEADGVRVVCIARAACDAQAARLGQYAAAPEFRRWLSGALAAADAVAQQEAFDVVEATDFGFTFLPFVLGLGGAPVVAQLHGSIGQIARHELPRPSMLLDETLSRLAELTALPHAADLQTYARGNASEWRERLKRDVRVMPPPVAPIDGVKTGTAEKNDAVVVGRIQAWKGPDVLCEALEITSDPGLTITWVGRDTPTAAGGSSYSADLGRRFPRVWGSHVRPAGPKHYTDTLSIIESASIVVVPSTWDVFNLSAAEAMSLGRVVICSSAAGASDLIADGENGFVFESSNASALAETLARARRLSSGERRRMGEAARATVRTQLDPDRIARERLQRYEQIAREWARPAARPADWLADAFAAGERTSGVDFLDQLAVRDLSKYLGRRIGARLSSQAR